jgi:WD40 repeat protein
MLASASEDGTVRLWSIPGGQSRSVLSGHTDHALCLAYHPAGNWLASGGRDNTVRVWDVSTGQIVATLPGGKAYFSSIDFTRNGDVLVAGDSDGTLFFAGGRTRGSHFHRFRMAGWIIPKTCWRWRIQPAATGWPARGGRTSSTYGNPTARG